MEHLREALARDLEAAEVVILDMRRVLRVDLTALRVLEQMAGKMRARGARLLISHAPPNLGEVRRELHGPDRFEPYYPGEHLEIFAETNEALEAAEDWWLEKQGITPRRGGIVAPEEAELLRELAPEVRAKVLAKMRRVKRAEGEFLFRAGEPGEELFVVLEGEVEVWLRLPEGDYMRLAVYGPGATFGELSFLEPGPRAADAVVTQDFVGLALPRRDWDALAQENPQAALVLLVRLAHELAEHLRRADATIQRLAR
ncbi:MAG: STAS domain-containing protein [Zetaproteobacteria bacterium]|nr:MAG: STAS domain-containing protein [Zetaproteobacteria bacterium]